ncbi:hypothetical protein EVAR_73503_1 [Eumeta japonica]|uniref:Uncharacterized protein n=1 Tax=Eumeta variegata TaxID=151549 RepID=A0A4C1TM52_EUMVA|nr:hypothetical protein EVAR_73503_1 [Eumeta japonica]
MQDSSWLDKAGVRSKRMLMSIKADMKQPGLAGSSHPLPLTNETSAPKQTVDSSDKSEGLSPKKPPARRPPKPTSTEEM